MGRRLRDPPLNFYTVFRKGQSEAENNPQSGRKRKSRGVVVYTCTVCPPDPQPWATSQKGNAMNHCVALHDDISYIAPSTPNTINRYLHPDPNTLRRVFNQDAYNEAIVGLLTVRRVAFSGVEWPELRQLALACNPACGDLLIQSRRTAVRLVFSNYLYYRDQLKQLLSLARSPIHIQSDLWTSPHRHSLLAVCAQWVDQDFQLQKALLGLPECATDHSGLSQANLILQVLNTFEITSNIGWHTGDNATSNDTCLETLEHRLLAEHQVSFIAILATLANLLDSIQR